MRRLVASLFISLDGVIQGPGGPDEDRSGDFRLGGWVAAYPDPLIGENLQDLIARPFELLLGRRTYDIFASYWPHVPDDAPSHALAARFNAVVKHVATHRPAVLPWEGSQPLTGSLAEAVHALKQGEGDDLLTFGSGQTVRQLIAAGLVDELRLQVFPLVLGRGRRLFADDMPAAAFTLADTARTARGVLLNRYLKAGEVDVGTVGWRPD
jgi:dihydrofolate reductase